MAIIKCVECGRDVSDCSKTCPHCGCSTAKSIRAENDRKTQEQWNNMSPKEKRVGVITTIVILVLICVFFCKACLGTVGVEDNYNTDNNAKICAEKAVEDRLKTPSTAEFCPYYQMTAINLGGDKWKVSGYVDAQNSFGAVIRKEWTVTLTLTETGFKDYFVSFL